MCPEDKEAAQISVIVPTLNEEAVISDSLKALRNEDLRIEIIVSDGGSTDATRDKAAIDADSVLITSRGRAAQMNHGADKARGNIFFFLHADCIIPTGAFVLIKNALCKPGVSAGAFDLKIAHNAPWARAIEGSANLRSRILKIPYGDQGLFMTRQTFESIGGFKPLALMEDVEIAGKLKAIGKIAFLKEKITTSPRRWIKGGVVRTTLKDWKILFMYWILRVPTERLARMYGDIR
jgi:rSAM/selenodomain-associated transferase 2